MKAGDKVMVISTFAARRVGALVEYGDKGTVDYTFDNKATVNMDAGNCWSIPQRALELIEEEKTPMEQVKTIYKAVHIEERGGYSSIYAGHRGVYPMLPYKIGEVTRDEVRTGVRCWESKEQAIKHADGTLELTITHPTAVLEVYPVGCAPFPDRDISRTGALTAKAIYVVREVWREEALKPMPKFKVGDRVKIVNERGAHSWNGVTVGTVGIVDNASPQSVELTIPDRPSKNKGHHYVNQDYLELAPEPSPTPKFKVGDRIVVECSHTGITVPATGVIEKVAMSEHFRSDPKHWHCVFHDEKRKHQWTADEDEVKLAPPEEVWRDITEECVGRFNEGQLYIGYKCYWVAIVDSQGGVHTSPKFDGTKGFKVETERAPSNFGNSIMTPRFKVLKRV